MARSKLVCTACLEIDIVSQEETKTQALTNLREALLLHLQPPVATITAKISTFEVKKVN